MKNIHNIKWWGAPKKLDLNFKERKISWLELFFDLVYVIAISKITSYLSESPSVSRLLDYFYMFAMIFWGWLNGSLYHDLHGNSGMRTKIMTLWQISIIAAIIITLNSPPTQLLFNLTIALMVMQAYITYIWWSVGLYEPEHRTFNKPYTWCFTISLLLIFATLFVEQPYVRILYYFSLFVNYVPAFFAYSRLKNGHRNFSFSDSMIERLGLLTIILFGEVVLGVINGISAEQKYDFMVWVNFVLTISIVFVLWWIFFSMIADKRCDKGFLKSNIMAMVYIPTLMSLGFMGVSFNKLFETEFSIYPIKMFFGIALSIFLLGMTLLMQFLTYPDNFKAKKRVQKKLIVAIIFILFFNFMNFELPITVYLIVHLILLISIIFTVSKSWYLIEFDEFMIEENDD